MASPADTSLTRVIFFLSNLLWMNDMLCINYSTTVIEKIKGKPRSLFWNKRMVIGKMMHINTYSKHKPEIWNVKTKMCLLISHTLDLVFVLVYCIEHIFSSLQNAKRGSEPHPSNTPSFQHWFYSTGKKTNKWNLILRINRQNFM
jgi:hypothetical protein